jgi:hypothetical protein
MNLLKQSREYRKLKRLNVKPTFTNIDGAPTYKIKTPGLELQVSARNRSDVCTDFIDYKLEITEIKPFISLDGLEMFDINELEPVYNNLAKKLYRFYERGGKYNFFDRMHFRKMIKNACSIGTTYEKGLGYESYLITSPIGTIQSRTDVEIDELLGKSLTFRGYNMVMRDINKNITDEDCSFNARKMFTMLEKKFHGKRK